MHGQMCKYIMFSPLIKIQIVVQNCIVFQPINPLEFAKCSVECGEGSSEEKNRGLMGDLAACVIQCVSIQISDTKIIQKLNIFLETEP